MVHAFKIHAEYYEAVKNGKKPFEVRTTRTDLTVGDILALNEFISGEGYKSGYTGRSIIARISYFLSSDKCCPGHCVVGLTPCKVINDIVTGIAGSSFELSVKKFKEVTRND